MKLKVAVKHNEGIQELNELIYNEIKILEAQIATNDKRKMNLAETDEVIKLVRSIPHWKVSPPSWPDSCDMELCPSAKEFNILVKKLNMNQSELSDRLWPKYVDFVHRDPEYRLSFETFANASEFIKLYGIDPDKIVFDEMEREKKSYYEMIVQTEDEIRKIKKGLFGEGK